MSFLKSIKGTLKNVQEDISGSLKSLTFTTEKPKIPETEFQFVSTVDYEAGADILHRNENNWKDLYDYTEETARKAQDVDVQIGNLYIYCDKQSETLMHLHDEASRLPTLISQLQAITDSLALVEEEYDKVEAALVHLENLCEEQDFRRNVLSHHKQLAVYEMKKDHELQKFKVQLARQHAHKVEQVNKKKQYLLHEKQAAYDEQFAKEVDYYKKHGKPGRLPSMPESEQKLDLSEIEIEEDQEALDAFLESADTVSDVNDMSAEVSVSEIGGPSPEVIADIASPSQTALTSATALPEPDDSSISVTFPDSQDQSRADFLVENESANLENLTGTSLESSNVPESNENSSSENESHSSLVKDNVDKEQ